MAVNLSKNYNKAADQVYTLKSLTKKAFNLKYEFIGANTAVVYTLTSQALVNYTRSGVDRFGVPAELLDTINEYTITRDRAFSVSVDKGNMVQQSVDKTAGKVVKIQMEERLIPRFWGVAA